jgi:hypothetical protein
METKQNAHAENRFHTNIINDNKAMLFRRT